MNLASRGSHWVLPFGLGLLVIGALMPVPSVGAEPRSRAVPVVDLHVDLSYQVNYQGKDFEQASGQLLASELEAAGVVGVVLPLYVPHEVSPVGPRLEDLESSYLRMFDRIGHSSTYAMPGCVDGGRPVRTFLALEGSAPLASDPEQVARWVARGVRVFGLVHSHDNAVATSAGMVPRRVKHGLTPAGRALVARAQELGALVDVSHASDAATDEVIAMAREAGVPVLATHSNCRALADHARNLTDAQIRAIGETGGVVGINFHGPYLASGRPPRLADVVAHVRHVVSTAGIDHVAIGSDYEGGIRPPPELRDVRGFPALARALAEAGFSSGEVEQILSGNALRVLCSSRARAGSLSARAGR